MGQKVNPHGARVGVIYDWSTRWYSDKKDSSLQPSLTVPLRAQ